VALEVSLNLRRRHLSESQRAMVAANIATLPKGANQHAQVCAPTQTEAADMLNVSRRTVQAAAKVRDEAVPELVEAVQAGAVSVSAAADVAALPKDEQAEILQATVDCFQPPRPAVPTARAGARSAAAMARRPQVSSGRAPTARAPSR
jgi:hypothetical protein